MSGRTQVNLETSVLFNYVYTRLPGEIEDDQDSLRLIDTPDYYCVTGGKAEGEFKRGCEHRNELYDDLLGWLDENPDAGIYDYDIPTRDVDWSPNDRTHVRFDMQHGWGEEPRRKQLADLRRCKQEIATFRELLPTELLDHVYEQAENEELLEALVGLNLGHDKGIVIDAVEICRTDEIDILVSTDPDLVDDDQIEEINNVIRETEGDALVLRIATPDEI
jgi:hypothetical protein